VADEQWWVYCSGAGVSGHTDWAYGELAVFYFPSLVILAVGPINPIAGWYSTSVAYSADPELLISVVVRFYDELHILRQTVFLYGPGSCEGATEVANIDGTLEYQIQDDNGLVNPATFYVKIADSKTLANLQTELNTMTPLVAAVTDGATPKINLTLHFAVNSGNASPVAESNNNEAANITFDVSGIKYPWTLNIPNFKDSLAVQGQIANSGATASLVTYLVSGATDIGFVDKYLNDLTAFNRGRTTFRGNRKQLARAASGRHNA